ERSVLICWRISSRGSSQHATSVVIKTSCMKSWRCLLTVKLQNIVASIDLGGGIRLPIAARSLPRCMYEPEQFPGIIYRMIDPKTVILIFVSGKLVCAGARNEADVYRSVHSLHRYLEERNLMKYQERPA
ncbi:MAG: TATA box-binding protein, partial [Nitrosotalea sp.]